MKRVLFPGLAAAAGLGLLLACGGEAAEKAKTAAELEKETALANPYPNDFGPERIDEIVKGYPAKYKKGYDLTLSKCARCHTSARPLNSRFLEPDAPKAKREGVIAGWKKTNPEMFKDRAVWQIETNIWSRYVQRMQAKPGCDLSNAEAKEIWAFLVYDSNRRKAGKKAGEWAAHRKKLLDKLKSENPKRYAELEKSNDL